MVSSTHGIIWIGNYNLQRKLDQTENKKLFKSLEWFKFAFLAISQKAVPSDRLQSIINQLEEAIQMREINRAKLGKIKREFITTLETEHHLVFKGHYQQKWMLYGMMFGIPFGTVFSTALNNYGFIGIGLPIGMAIGIALGTDKDKKAAEEDRVLDLAL